MVCFLWIYCRTRDNIWRSPHPPIFDGIGPINWLKDRKRPFSAWSWLHILGGRVPDKPLKVRSMYSREEILKILEGISPVSWFIRIFSDFKLWRLPISLGILPCKLLLPICKVSSIDKLHKDSGIRPEKLLFMSCKCCSLCKLSIFAGICPMKLLKFRWTEFIRYKLANSRGIWPWKLLLLISIETRKERLPMCGGMVPIRDKLGRCKVTTLWWRMLQETPIQLLRWRFW